jgi:hypothetical protein
MSASFSAALLGRGTIRPLCRAGYDLDQSLAHCRILREKEWGYQLSGQSNRGRVDRHFVLGESFDVAARAIVASRFERDAVRGKLKAPISHPMGDVEHSWKIPAPWRARLSTEDVAADHFFGHHFCANRSTERRGDQKVFDRNPVTKLFAYSCGPLCPIDSSDSTAFHLRPSPRSL